MAEKRKCTIFSLEHEDRMLTDPDELKDHITKFYRELFGSEQRGGIRLRDDIWAGRGRGRLSETESLELVQPFTMEELELSVKEMNTNTALGPDGFPVGFYKTFWPQVKDIIKEMLDMLFQGELDLQRLNYGVITLIPKLKDAKYHQTV